MTFKAFPHSLSVLLLIPMFLLLTACQPAGDLGSRDNPVRLYFTPSVDAETIASNSREFIRFLEQETGDYYVSGIPTSYIAVVEAFGSGRADIGAMNSFGYLMATVIGLVGGGGIGTMLMQYQGLARWNEVGTLVIMIAAIVWVMDYASAKIRAHLK